LLSSCPAPTVDLAQIHLDDLLLLRPPLLLKQLHALR
jgi:hypothetical protein